jgi:glycerate 2-kinase
VLAALAELIEHDAQHGRGIAILSAGTDGEDGPTDAAGAWLDSSIVAAVQQRNLDPRASLGRNDAYHFFEPLGALIKTGPTHTNVCDVRVVVVEQSTQEQRL